MIGIIICMLVVVMVYTLYMGFHNITRASDQCKVNREACNTWCSDAISNHDYTKVDYIMSNAVEETWAEVAAYRNNLYGQVKGLASWFVPIDKASHVWSPETSEAVAAYNEAIAHRTS